MACKQIMIVFALTAVGVASYIYHRFIGQILRMVIMTVYYVIDSPIFIDAVNCVVIFFMSYSIGMACYASGFFIEYTYNEKFKAVTFAFREKLKQQDFFSTHNLQSKGIFNYPMSADNALDQANSSFTTILVQIRAYIAIAMLSVIISLIPDSRYLTKCLYHFALTAISMIIAEPYYNLTTFDMVVIRADQEHELDEIIELAQQDDHGLIDEDMQNVFRNRLEREAANRRNIRRPNLRRAQAEIRPNNGIYPQSQKFRAPNYTSMNFFAVATWFSTFVILRVIGSLGAWVIKYLLNLS